MLYNGIAEAKVPDMRDLNHYVIKTHAAEWKSIGLELKLKNATLEIISKNNPGDCITCFKETLDQWLICTPSATWHTLELAITNVRRAYDGLDRVTDIYGKGLCVTCHLVHFYRQVLLELSWS